MNRLEDLKPGARVTGMAPGSAVEIVSVDLIGEQAVNVVYRTPVRKRYERICFDKSRINQQPVAAFVCPGHPLLDAVISLVRKRFDHLMKQGAVLVDDTDPGDGTGALFLLEHSVQDGRSTAAGGAHVISERMQFTSIDRTGRAVNVGIAPHLDLRPAEAAETDAVRDLLDEDWLRGDLEKMVIEFATMDLARAHVGEVRARRLSENDKVEREVRARLGKEINYWDARAFELKEEERAGRKTRLNWQNAERRAEDLAERLKRRMMVLEQERFISARPPRVRGGMIVIPCGLLDARVPTAGDGRPPGFAEDPVARREIELKAMDAVMADERALGNTPTDVSDQKVGYDIASHDPKTEQLRFIEVNGRIADADTVMVMRQEVITALHEPDKFILVIVQVENGLAREPRHVRRPLGQEPEFGVTAIQVRMKGLLERSEVPA